jgi:hypothetical protein
MPLITRRPPLTSALAEQRRHRGAPPEVSPVARRPWLSPAMAMDCSPDAVAAAADGGGPEGGGAGGSGEGGDKSPGDAALVEMSPLSQQPMATEPAPEAAADASSVPGRSVAGGVPQVANP